MIAYLNVDEVIRIIRREDEPKPVLMKRFTLTDVQAEYILELKLRFLNKLQEMEIRGEQKKLAGERAELEKVLELEAEAAQAGARRAARGHGGVRRQAPLADRRARSGESARSDGAHPVGSRSRSCSPSAGGCAPARGTISIRARCSTSRATRSCTPRKGAAISWRCSSTRPAAATRCRRTSCRRRRVTASR